jgi:hypothetical protein
MNHPENENLLALFDGELSDIETARIEQHVETCAACRQRLAELEETSLALTGVIAGLDAAEPASWPTPRPAPRTRVFPIERRFAPGPARGSAERDAFDGLDDTAARETPDDHSSDVLPLRTRRRSGGAGPLRWAAGILLLAGAGAAAAIYARPSGDSPALETSPAVQAATPGTAEPNVFRVTPDAGSLDISLTGVAVPTEIVVTFANEGDVTVEATGPDELHVQNPRGSMTLDLGATPATLRITFPSSLAAGTIRVDGRTIARVSAGRIDRTGPIEGVTLTVEAADRS